MDIEQALSSIIFFPTIKNGSFDYSTPMKSSITKFDIDKTYEPSQSLFEYLCYKIVKKKLLEGKINSEIVLITEKFLSTFNCKKIFIKANAIHKKHIIIFLQNKLTLKWNLIAFLNLEEQLRNCFDENHKQPIIAKIISSNINSDEDDYILKTTINKLENSFNLKSPDDIQFEVDSINISNQPNTCIFLLNFIERLIVLDDENIYSYIKKLYDEGSNNVESNSSDYFNSFSIINEEFENIYKRYQNELNEYFKKTKNNIISFDAEKIMNGNNEIFNIENNNEIKQKDENLIEGNGTSGSSPGVVNGKEKNNLKKGKIKDEIDMIQIEQDDDLDSEEEEEALKIMERENKEAKSQMREQERKLRQRIYKQKLRLKNINMYKEFGVIKEEDNESESESIDIFNKMKEEKGNIKKSLRKSVESKKNKLYNKNYNNSKISPDNNKIIVLNTENNINNNNNSDIEKEIFKKEINRNKEKDRRSKSEKSIKLSVLRDLEEAIEELETEQEPIKNKEENIINLNIKKKNNPIIKENRQIEKKNSAKIDNYIDENKKDKKYINIFKNNVFKDNLDIKKISSIPKNKEKEINKITEKLKKSFTSTRRPDKDKEKLKEKKNEDSFIKNKKINSLTKKKSFKENNSNNNIIKIKDQNLFNINKRNKTYNSNKIKDQDNNNINNNANNLYNTNSFNSNSNSSKSNNEQEKYIKEKDNNSNKKEISENSSLNNMTSNMKTKKISKNKSIQNTSKLNMKKINDKQGQMPLATKISVSSQKSSTTSRSGEIHSQSSGERNSKKKSKKYKEIEIKIGKNNTDFSLIDNPMNVLPPQKKVERNGYYDLNTKDIFENESCSNLKINLNIDINSVQSDRINGDYSSNINIENIFSDDFESEKERNDRYEIRDEDSFLGENRTKKTLIRRGDKKIRTKLPPGKPKSMHRPYNDYCNYDEEGANKICGCIGEQSNGLCSIF